MSTFVLTCFPIELPIQVLSNLNNQTIMEDEEAKFSCQLSKEKAEVKWELNGSELNASDNIKISSNGFDYYLDLLHCKLDQNGRVTLTTKDCSTTGTLTVKG